MLFTLTTTYQPASDLGYLLHKHPQRVQSFELAFGQAHVFYPEATPERCTAALLLEINPVALVRGSGGFALAHYVNDRPYVASSFLSVAIAQVYGSAMSGRSKDRPDLVGMPLPLEARLSVLPSRGGEGLLHRLFGPLGYELTTERQPLDTHFPEWGMSPYYNVTLRRTVRLSELLTHLYVLTPVLDDEKHYYVGADEVEKLLQRGQGWLAAHPERALIVARYLRYRRSLREEALARLSEEDQPEPDAAALHHDAEEAAIEAPLSLHQQRLEAVLTTLKERGAQRVIDLGCGEGRLLAQLLKEPQFTAILGMDVSYRALEIAAERLHLDRLPSRQQERLQLVQGSLLYRDPRLEGYEAAAVVEVIEHLDPPRLNSFERVLFEAARPQIVVITTPNAEYNVVWPSLPAGKFRHKDHRFEWSRAEFQQWAEGVASRHGYQVYFQGIGPEAAGVGAPSQMGVFERL